MKILVAGGTGLIGRRVVAALNAAGHRAVGASRSTGVNTVSGVGLAAVATGAGAVLDATDAPAADEQRATAFFRASTRNLLIAEGQTGVRHHVVLSAVGADEVAGYYRAKLAQEQAVRAGRVPFTIVRSTALYESIDAIVRAHTADGTVRLPPTLIQPIALADLVPALAAIVAGPPAGGIVELAGPEPIALDEFARRLLGRATRVERDPGLRPFYGAEVADRALLPGRAARLASTGPAQWLSRSQGINPLATTLYTVD